MSWCRWSTVCDNNRTSDLYIYESMYGVTIHIAGNKIVNESDAPRLPELTKDTVKEYWDAESERSKWLDENGVRQYLNFEYAGDTFNFDDSEELLLFLNKLKKIGYNFPDRVFEYAKEWEQEQIEE